MNFDTFLSPYIRSPDVARWLFSTEPVTSVTPQQLSWSFVYSIAMGTTEIDYSKPLQIEDVVIPTATSGYFILGFLKGLGQPHLFSRTPLMYKCVPVSRRFAINTATTDAVEFVEFDIFDDGKVLIIFRRFLHTRDGSLPCVVYTSLHAPSSIPYTLGSIVMRAEIFESATCPSCRRFTTDCVCNYSADIAPYAAVSRQISHWDHYKHHMINKDKVSTARLSLYTVFPNGNDVTIASTQFSVVNVISAGNSPYLNLVRRKVIQNLGLNVVVPRAECQIIPFADANDYTNLHRQYMSRKRLRTGDQVQHWNNQATENWAFEYNGEWQGQALGLEQRQGKGQGQGQEQEQEHLNASERLLSCVPDPGDLDADTGTHNDVLSLLSSYFNATANTFAEDCADADQTDTNVVSETPFQGYKNSKNLIENDVPDYELDVTSIEFGKMPPFNRCSPSLQSNVAFDTSTISDPLLSINPLTPRSTEQRDSILRDLEAMLFPKDRGHLQQDSTPQSSTSSSSTADKSLRQRDGDSNGNESGSEDFLAGLKNVVEETRDVGRARQRRKKCKKGGDSGEENDEERKHGCTLCSSRFKMRGDLQRHVKIVHEGQKSYTCTTCGKSFGHSGHLNRHVNSVHLQQRRFKCPLCGFQFFQASHLQSHMNHIHGDKKCMECDHCGIRVKSQSAMRYHLTVCDGIKVAPAVGGNDLVADSGAFLESV